MSAKGNGPYQGEGDSYTAACDKAHEKAAKDGHGENDWLVVDEVLVRGHNPIIEYLVKISPHG